MKTARNSQRLFPLLLIGMFMLVGCNWMQLLAFRSQMRDISASTAWEGDGNAVFVFKKPLLTMRDLNDSDVYPEVLDERSAVLRYHRMGAPPNTPTEYEIRLQFLDGKLAGLIFPPPLRDGLGQDNIKRMFALIGGSDAPGLTPVPKAQLIQAGLFPKTVGALGHEAVIDLMPIDPRNQPIYIKMTEGRQVDHYSGFLISFKRRS